MPALGGGEGWGADSAGSSLVLRDENYSIAERNEEINRRRMERARSGNGGPAKITDMTAYKKFLANAAEAAEKARALETAEEMERMQREGKNYKPKAQREAEARARRERYKTGGGEDEARGVQSWCNPLKDYYKILGVDKTAALAEIKKAYKRLAIQYHPDKQRNATEEQLEALKDKFKDVMEAYDVLNDEERRQSWERLRESMKSGGGGAAAVRSMTPEEAAAYMHGLRELAMIKRQGYKRTKKHSPIEKEVKVSMRKMYSGHNKTVTIERTECDSTGGLLKKQKVFHLMIRKGAYDGMKITFEDEGDETTEYLPGDVIFVMKQKQQKEFKRSGPKDLVHIGPPIERGNVWYLHSVTSLAGTNIIMFGNALARSLESGGMGGFIEESFEIEGCQDPEDPWENNPGDLIIKLYNTGVRLEERVIRSAVAPHPCFMIGSGCAVGAGAIAGHYAADAVLQRIEGDEMAAEEYQTLIRKQALKDGNPEPVFPNSTSRTILGVCFCLSVDGKPTAAASAAMEAASVKMPMLAWKCITTNHNEDLTVMLDEDSTADSVLFDEDYVALNNATIVILDMDLSSSSTNAHTEEKRSVRERMVLATAATLARTGIRAQLCTQWMAGTQILAVGDAVALLGEQPQDIAGDINAEQWHRTALVPLVVRCGGGEAGWKELHNAVGSWPGLSRCKGVGIMKGCLLMVNPSIWWDPDGSVEMIMAPPQDALIATAAAVNNGGHAFRWADEFDEEENERIAADEGFNERCTKEIVLGAS